MKSYLNTKFFILAVLSLIIAPNMFGQTARPKTETTVLAAPIQDWKTYDICNDSVRAAFPAAPIESVENNSADMTTKLNRATAGDTLYMVTCVDNAPINEKETSPAIKRKIFDSTMNIFIKKMEEVLQAQGFVVKPNLLEVREATLGELPGFEQDFTLGDIQGKSKMVIYDRHMLWGIALNTTPDEETTTAAFFNSLKILPVEKK